MPREAIPASPTLGRLLRSRRQELALSLEDVHTRTRRHGQPIPVSTLARIEQGKADPGVLRMVQLLRLYGVPAQYVADLVETHDLQDVPPPKGDLQSLYHDGVLAWKKGDAPLGFAYFFAVRHHPVRTPEDRLLRQKATLAFSIAARDVGRYRLAQQLVDELLCEPPDPSILVQALIHAASIWLGRGSADAALAFLQQAESRAPRGDRQVAAWLWHQRARAFALAGQRRRATAALDKALAHYRALGDAFGEAKARLTALRHIEPLDRGRALAEARALVADATAADTPRVAAHARLELGRLLTGAGCADEAIAVLREALAQALLLGDREIEFRAHFNLHHAYLAAGDDEHAVVEHRAATFLAGFIEEEVCAEAAQLRRPSRGHDEQRPNRSPRQRSRRRPS